MIKQDRLHLIKNAPCVKTHFVDCDRDMMKIGGVSVMNLLFLFLFLPLIGANNDIPFGENSGNSGGLIESLANFGTRFYREIIGSADRRHNIVVSPLSVYMVLAILRVGAVERSRFQIDQAMALPRGDGIDIMLKDFVDLLLGENRTMNIANKIW